MANEVIIGVDESGRGALAGPLVVAATAFLREREQPVTAIYHTLRGDKVVVAGDSKKFKNAGHREVLDKAIREAALATVVVERSSKEIDARLMYVVFPETIRLAISRCLEQVVHTTKFCNPDAFLVMVDGEIQVPNDLPCQIRTVVDGDKRVWQIGAASIVAKVARDARMMELHARYPKYGFDQNKGYPVPEHKKLLKKYGPSEVHRGTFKPVVASRPLPDGFEE